MKPEQLKVLFVDDSATIRTKVRQLFNRLGVTNYHDAIDGLKALNMAEKAHQDGAPFDLIVSDLNMAEMNGFELLKTIRRHANLKIQKTKFIIVTSKPENVLIAVDLGANQRLHKPFDEKELGLRLCWVLGEEWEGEHFVLAEDKSTASAS